MLEITGVCEVKELRDDKKSVIAVDRLILTATLTMTDSRPQSWTWVDVVKSNLIQSTSWLIQSNPIQSTMTMCIPTHIQSNPLYPAVTTTLSVAIHKMFSLSI